MMMKRRIVIISLLWTIGCLSRSGAFADEGGFGGFRLKEQRRQQEVYDRRLIGFDSPGSEVRRASLIAEDGGRVSWSPDGTKIAFERNGRGGYSDIWAMDADGSAQQCLTCGHFEISKNAGAPVFCPAGNYLLFTAQNPYYAESDQDFSADYLLSSRLWMNRDLWILDLRDSSLTPLTHVKKRHGIMPAHFSCDGTKIVWSELASSPIERLRSWVIRVADLSFENGRPVLSHVKTLKPKHLRFYETYDFSPDGRSIIFSGVSASKPNDKTEIYVLDLQTNRLSQLTDDDRWDGCVRFMPDGRYIIWISDSDVFRSKRTRAFSGAFETPQSLDLWIMNADGSQKRRLSYFNDPQSPEYIDSPEGIVIKDFDIHPSGNRMIATVEFDHHQVVVRIDLDQKLSAFAEDRR